MSCSHVNIISPIKNWHIHQPFGRTITAHYKFNCPGARLGFLPCSQSKYISAGPSLNWNHFSHQFAKATTQYPINKSLAKKSKINDKRSSWENQTLKIVVLFSRLITSINRILYAPRFLTQVVFFASLLKRAYTSILFDGKWSSACVVPFYVVYFPLYPPLPLPPLEGAGGGGFLYLGKNWSHYQIQQLSHGSCLIEVEYDTSLTWEWTHQREPRSSQSGRCHQDSRRRSQRLLHQPTRIYVNFIFCSGLTLAHLPSPVICPLLNSPW